MHKHLRLFTYKNPYKVKNLCKKGTFRCTNTFLIPCFLAEQTTRTSYGFFSMQPVIECNLANANCKITRREKKSRP